MNRYHSAKSSRKAFLGLALAAGFFSMLCPVSMAQQQLSFINATEAFSDNELHSSWGNPIWGDLNNDGLLDLIVPTNSTAPCRVQE